MQRQQRAGLRTAGRQGPAKREHVQLAAAVVDLALEGFPRRGEGGGGAAVGRGPLWPLPNPTLCAPSGSHVHARSGQGAQQARPWRNEDQT